MTISTASSQNASSIKGFSLVELLIAMVLGLILVSGTVTIFSSSVRNSEFNQSMANMQANARFAMGRIAADVRLAGFQGCSGLGNAQLSIRTAPSPTNNFARTAISGALIDNAGWTPAEPEGFTPPTGPGAPVPGTQALMVQYAVGPGERVTSDLGSTRGSITVENSEIIRAITADDLMVISDCSTADLFKVQSTGSGVDRKITPAERLSKAYALQSGDDDTLRVMPFVTAIYYIGDTGRSNDSADPVRSLYVQSFPYDATENPPIELVEGVDQMQLQFGVRGEDRRIRLMSPEDPAISFSNVESVQVGLLMSSFNRYPSVNKNRVYTISNQTIAPDSGGSGTTATYPADNRMRIAFTRSISVRNRILEND